MQHKRMIGENKWDLPFCKLTSRTGKESVSTFFSRYIDELKVQISVSNPYLITKESSAKTCDATNILVFLDIPKKMDHLILDDFLVETSIPR